MKTKLFLTTLFLFGIMLGKPQAYQSAVHAVNDQAGVSIYLPMPFSKNARITIANEGPEPSVCYYSIDYTEGDKVERDSGRLHVLYHRENPTTLKKDNFYSIYRWFIKDPIYWKKDIRATIQQIGAYGDVKGVPHFFERQDDWITATFWYEPVPSAPLPPLLKYEERIKNL